MLSPAYSISAVKSAGCVFLRGEIMEIEQAVPARSIKRAL